MTVEASATSKEPKQFTIFNASGDLVISQKWDGRLININTFEWPAGVYLIEWKSDEEVIHKKVIKQ